MSALILPGDPEFDWTLGTLPPPAPAESVFVVRAGGSLLEPLSPNEVQAYLVGGEYDQRMAELGLDGDDEDAFE